MKNYIVSLLHLDVYFSEVGVAAETVEAAVESAKKEFSESDDAPVSSGTLVLSTRELTPPSSAVQDPDEWTPKDRMVALANRYELSLDGVPKSTGSEETLHDVVLKLHTLAAQGNDTAQKALRIFWEKNSGWVDMLYRNMHHGEE